jgi:hypothetical protein
MGMFHSLVYVTGVIIMEDFNTWRSRFVGVRGLQVCSDVFVFRSSRQDLPFPAKLLPTSSYTTLPSTA